MKYVLLQGLSSIHAENCGVAILNPGWIHPGRTLDTSVLILGKKSRVELLEGKEALRIEPEKFTILASGISHQGASPIAEQASYYWMHFKCTEEPVVLDESDAHAVLNNETVTQTRLKDAILLPKEISLPDSKAYREMFHELLFEQENPSFTEHKFQVLFRMLLIKINEFVLSEHTVSTRIPDSHSLIYATIQTIFENLTSCNFSVKILADIMQYNPDYLGRLFKTVMGKSLGEYIIDQRIKNAVTRLIESNDTIDKISYESGFFSCRNFIRQFKSRKGMTPSELRTRHRTMHITNI
ncbi:helix-turn-helix transcriptional regulator [Marispirochaeta sp.]|jgi:YesN/AraC family two-component response regulator|uniref:helix-turn-helix domain-containing protein n=1 Tax=Marispirochaeta sp. TaxID=2038653 RepID=UPI0029C74EE0|nr:helix-turn-helix transcriptional regulator [Marispirochaeta sp.]